MYTHFDDIFSLYKIQTLRYHCMIVSIFPEMIPTYNKRNYTYLNKKKLQNFRYMKTTKRRLMELASVKSKKALHEAKSNIKTTWRNVQDLEADMQDWMSTLDAQQVQEVLDTLQNFVDNYEGEMDMDDDF